MENSEGNNPNDTNMEDTNMEDTNMEDTNIEDTNIEDLNLIVELAAENNGTYRESLIGDDQSSVQQEDTTQIINESNNELHHWSTTLDESRQTIRRFLDNIRSVYEPEDISNNIDETYHENPNSLLSYLLQRSFNERPKYKNVLSEKGEENLERIIYNDILNTNIKCPITQENFKLDMEVIKLPCNHCFVPDAIIRWLKEENAICPICRYALDSKEEKIEESTNSTMNLINSLNRTDTSHIARNVVISPSLTETVEETFNPHTFLRSIVERATELEEQRLQIEEENRLQEAIINSLSNT